MNTTSQKIKQVIARVAMVPISEVTESTRISSLGVTSFDQIECVLALEETFQVELPQESLGMARTVADFIATVESVLAKESTMEKA